MPESKNELSDSLKAMFQASVSNSGDDYQNYGLLPERIQEELNRRAMSSPGMKQMKDIARVMQAGPVIAGASEAGGVLGGAGLNLNPLLAWASGLPGANKQQLSALQTPHRSPSDIVAGLMGMGDAASKSAQRYAQSYNQAGGTGKSSSMSPLSMLIFRKMLDDQKQTERWDREDKKQAEKEAREAEKAAKQLSLEQQETARKAYEDWNVRTQKNDYPSALSAASQMFSSYNQNPGDLYADVFGYKLNKKNWFDFMKSPESREFYSALEGFIQPLLRKNIGSQQTKSEMQRVLKAMNAGNLSSFDELRKAYNRYLDDVSASYRNTLGPLKATPGGLGYKLWKAYETDYGTELSKYKLPPLPGETRKASSTTKPRSGGSAREIKGATPQAQDLVKDILDF